MVATDHYKDFPAWSPQGLIAARVPVAGGHDIWGFPIDDPEAPVELIASASDEGMGTFSADGRFLAYTSNRSGEHDVYVTPMPGGPAEYEWKVTTSGGTLPRWSRDGTRLFYQAAGRVMMVEITQTDPFRTGSPQVFAESAGRHWDVGPDGSYIIAIEALPSPRPRLVLNWFEELKRLVPTDP